MRRWHSGSINMFKKAYYHQYQLKYFLQIYLNQCLWSWIGKYFPCYVLRLQLIFVVYLLMHSCHILEPKESLIQIILWSYLWIHTIVWMLSWSCRLRVISSNWVLKQVLRPDSWQNHHHCPQTETVLGNLDILEGLWTLLPKFGPEKLWQCLNYALILVHYHYNNLRSLIQFHISWLVHCYIESLAEQCKHVQGLQKDNFQNHGIVEHGFWLYHMSNHIRHSNKLISFEVRYKNSCLFAADLKLCEKRGDTSCMCKVFVHDPGNTIRGNITKGVEYVFSSILTDSSERTLISLLQWQI